MDSFKKFLKKAIYIITAIVAGLSLFVMQTSFHIDKSILNSDFHSHLFTKHSIYSHTYTIIENSMSGFVSSFKNTSSQSVEPQKDAFSLLENSITLEMVKYNLDSIREGIFQYLKGERRFLPDIYLKPKSNAISSTQTTSSNSSSPSDALTKINRINLSAILSYINRNDIIDFFFTMRLVYYVMKALPNFSLLVLLLATLIGLFLCRKPVETSIWLGMVFLLNGLLEFIVGGGSLIYIYWLLPSNIYPLVASIPLQQEVIISYIRDCVNSTSIIITISSILFIGVSIFMIILPRLSPAIFHKEYSFAPRLSPKSQSILKYSLFAVLFILLASFIGCRLYTIESDFKQNDFYTIISRMHSASTFTQVIPAKNDTIYTMHLKLVDDKTGKPVENVDINISGKSNLKEKSFNVSATTDDEGIAKFMLDKGTFKLSVNPEKFPSAYTMPSPFFFDLKLAGTTIITKNLEPKEETDKIRLGIAEVEVLDKDNMPVPNLRLTIQGSVMALGYPDNVYSYTNAEGIAVFKVSEKDYRVTFDKDKLPENYYVPDSMEVSVKADSVTRYTIRLVEVKEITPSPTTSPKPTTTKKPKGR